MTGFARIQGSHDAATWYWELRSVNGRSLDVRMRLPPGFESLEPTVREVTGALLVRGNVNVNLTLQRETRTTAIQINEDALAQVLAAADRVREVAGCAPPTAEGLLALKGVLETVDKDAASVDNEDFLAALKTSLRRAVEQLAEARGEEGAKLSRVVGAQIDDMERLVEEISRSPARAPEAIRERLTEQVNMLLGADKSLDEVRLHQEAALLATRADVEEELKRLTTHISAARELLAAEGAVGRKFDFLAQEFNREANTLCSKSNDDAITRSGLALKVLIDQMREQVQNVE